MIFFDDEPESRPGALPYERSERLTMGQALEVMSRWDPLLVLEQGTWFEIRDSSTAMAAETLSQTAVGHFYHKEAEYEGSHPRRWFIFVENSKDVRASVTMCVRPNDVNVRTPLLVENCHMVGFRNSNPFPAYADEIKQLSDEIGVVLPPNYAGRPLELRDANGVDADRGRQFRR